ncbi:MAG: penicillin-binding protein 2 [Actinomycetota bacterium]|nr:penicillin-binding protein 2 [Actinomycetota bacterium]
MFVFFVIAFGLMGARLFVLQIVEAPEYARLASAQRLKVVEFPARRGAIYDRSGRPLAISVDLQTVFADPALVTNAAAAASKLAPVLDMRVAALRAKLGGTRPGSRFEYIARQVEPKVANKVKALRLAGVFMEAEPKRFYPNGRVAAQLLGFVDIDGMGLSGLETQYEDILKGRPGEMSLEQDPSGRSLPQAEYTYDRPEPGRSLFLTIDKDIQYSTELALADAAQRYHAAAASAIVLDPRSGEVLAMANVPSFDPNKFWEFDQETYRNRAVTDVYEPGSAYKIVTAAGALQSNVITPDTSFVVPDEMPYADRVFHDSHFHATEEMTAAEIIQDSSNIGTIKIGLELGAEKLDAYVRKFGFGRATGLDFPGESSGIVLDLDEWSGSTIATIPLGQGIAVTAMQMASSYATLANRGVWVEPKLLHAHTNDAGEVVRSTPPTKRRVVSRRTAREMTEILTGVVTKGTGLEARIPGYAVAGKTGTAQKPLPGGGYGNSYTASFAGFVPADNPALVVIVVLDNPTPIWGGATAAPAFKAIAEPALQHLGIPPSGNAERVARELEAAQQGAEPPHD